MIKIIATGNLGADPVTKELGNSSVCNFSVASTETWKDKSGVRQTKTTWLRCSAWNKLGQTIQTHLKVGEKVIIEGTLRNSTYEKNGVTHYSTDCVVSSFEFCGTKQPA